MKSKCNFEYHVPETLGETLELLAAYGPDAKVIAGGTDLIPRIKDGTHQFGHLISLKDVKELGFISYDAVDGLRIGSMERLMDTEYYKPLQEHYHALYTGIHSMATSQVRHRGTVAGNICQAVPSADTAPSLLIYRAKVHIASTQGERTVNIEDFFTGVLKTVIRPDELVTEIDLPVPDPAAHAEYDKYSIRNAIDLAMVSVASYIVFDGSVVREARLALGAVATTPRRAYSTEAMLTGKKLTEELIEEAALTASQQDCRPISDIRATAEYRREMVRIYVRDALKRAVKENAQK